MLLFLLEKLGKKSKKKTKKDQEKKIRIAVAAKKANRGDRMWMNVQLRLNKIFVYLTDFDYGQGKFHPFDEQEHENRCKFEFLFCWMEFYYFIFLVNGRESKGYWEHIPEKYDVQKHFPLTECEYYRKYRMQI